MVVKSKRDPIYPLRNPSSCTRCPYNQTASPCFKCPGNTQLSNSGKCWLSLDALPIGLQPKLASDFTDAKTTSAPATALALDTEDYLRRLLNALASLSPDEMILVHGMLRSQSTRELGALFGDMTRQGISARIKQAVIKHPFLASLAAAYTKGPKTHSFRHLARAYAREAL